MKNKVESLMKKAEDTSEEIADNLDKEQKAKAAKAPKMNLPEITLPSMKDKLDSLMGKDYLNDYDYNDLFNYMKSLDKKDIKIFWTHLNFSHLKLSKWYYLKSAKSN